MKVVLIGDSGVGKTTLINKYVNDTFDDSSRRPSPEGSGNKVVKLKEMKTNVTLQIWDTAGQERFRSIVSNYYKDAHCAIVVFDITSKESFDAAKTWIDDVKSKAPEKVMIYL
eukprot:CAMPEP_0168341960 /NCGR_PEP_ID=MMETSP0213-20121227/15055_1 /TAXON_ID=151035 /ORGANISM="Euplotes harpa, Strain FSP1.4" /LENGTH=112 /DNA_ID=CAMNT_0008348657 /DNA_START=46 /DNA_END=385 /DNA_ORIENTATION=-